MCENNSALVNHTKIVHASDWSKTLFSLSEKITVLVKFQLTVLVKFPTVGVWLENSL